jgi:hypothetical protein
VALGPQANYTDWGTATCRRNLVPTIVDRGVSRGQRGGSPTVVILSFLDRESPLNQTLIPNDTCHPHEHEIPRAEYLESTSYTCPYPKEQQKKSKYYKNILHSKNKNFVAFSPQANYTNLPTSNDYSFYVFLYIIYVIC